MTITQLSCFRCLVEEGSVTKAAIMKLSGREQDRFTYSEYGETEETF